MDIQPISTSQMKPASAMASPIAGGRHDNQYQGALASVAQLLGSSVGDLKVATATQSLSQIAAAKGVSESRLETAIKDGLKSSGTKLSGTRLDNIAHRVAGAHTHRRGASGSHGSSTGADPRWDAQG